MNTDMSITADAVLQDQAVNRLRSGTAGTSRQLPEAKQKEIKKVSRDFEALYLNMMLKSMRQTVAEDKVTGGGKAEETYRFLLDQEYTNAAAKRGGVGIANMIEKELLKRYQVAGPEHGTRSLVGDGGDADGKQR